MNLSAPSFPRQSADVGSRFAINRIAHSPDFGCRCSGCAARDGKGERLAATAQRELNVAIVRLDELNRRCDPDNSAQFLTLPLAVPRARVKAGNGESVNSINKLAARQATFVRSPC